MLLIMITGEVPGHSTSYVLTTGSKDKDVFSKTLLHLITINLICGFRKTVSRT